MPTFRYNALDAQGQSTTGVLTALDRNDAVRKLLNQGQTATRLDEEVAAGKKPKQPAAAAVRRSRPTQTSTSSKAGFAFGGRPSLSRAEVATFIRELATALEAGLPMMQSLRTVRKQASGRAMPVILDHLIERVEAGDPFHIAARDYGPPFDDMIVGMLRAADASGEMSEVLHQLADLLERSIELRREVMGATFYPLIVASLIVVSAIILVTVLVPRLIEPLADQITLPWPTQVVLGIANFIKGYWLWCVVGIGAIVFGWRAWIASPANRLVFDRAKLQSPVLGRLLRDVAVARFTRTLGTLISSGLPILDALRITKNTLGNTALTDAITQVEDKVTSGKSLADPLEQCGLFPPLLIQVVSLGERSGRLESMLLHAASAFDRNVQTSIKLFTKALPPMMLIVMAALGGFVLAAILLPLLELQSLVS